MVCMVAFNNQKTAQNHGCDSSDEDDQIDISSTVQTVAEVHNQEDDTSAPHCSLSGANQQNNNASGQRGPVSAGTLESHCSGDPSHFNTSATRRPVNSGQDQITRDENLNQNLNQRVNTISASKAIKIINVKTIAPSAMDASDINIFFGDGGNDDITLNPLNQRQADTSQCPPIHLTNKGLNQQSRSKPVSANVHRLPLNPMNGSNSQAEPLSDPRKQNTNRPPISRTGQPLSKTPAEQSLSQNGNNTNGNGVNMEMIKRKMDSYLTASTKRLTDSVQRSPYAPFLTYLGSKLDGVPSDIMPALEKAIIDTVFSFANGCD